MSISRSACCASVSNCGQTWILVSRQQAHCTFLAYIGPRARVCGNNKLRHILGACAAGRRLLSASARTGSASSSWQRVSPGPSSRCLPASRTASAVLVLCVRVCGFRPFNLPGISTVCDLFCGPLSRHFRSTNLCEPVLSGIGRVFASARTKLSCFFFLLLYLYLFLKGV